MTRYSLAFPGRRARIQVTQHASYPLSFPARHRSGAVETKSMADVLVADDDPANRALMHFVLESIGGHHVRATDTVAGVLELLREREPDVLVLDVVLPGVTGLDLCRRLRRGGALPILLVSARSDPADRVTGLRSGADDYLAKPFDPVELVERVNALLRRARRARADPSGATLRAGDFRLHLIDRRVWVAGRGPIELTPNECRLLYIMLSRPDTVWPRDVLLQRLWDLDLPGAVPATAIETCIARLRRKIERSPRRPVYLQTVRGLGYRLRSCTEE